MFNSVQYVRDLCKQKDIAIARLEKDCGFSNGYLNPKKQTKLPYDRAVKIAEYLDVPYGEILNGPDAKKEQPIATDELSPEKQEMYNIIDNLSTEQVCRLIQIARAAFDQQTT